MTLTDVRCVLPDFRYRAVDPSGIVEHEVCPVYTARALTGPVPHPEEVMDLTWVTPATLRWLARETPWALSPWTVLQVGAADRTAGAR
jgi:isopentenyl-diphosphate delta-isomerase